MMRLWGFANLLTAGFRHNLPAELCERCELGDLILWPAGEMRGKHFDTDRLAGGYATDGWRIKWQHVPLADEPGRVAKLFRSAVVVKKAIVLPSNICQFRVNVGGKPAMTAQFALGWASMLPNMWVKPRAGMG